MGSEKVKLKIYGMSCDDCVATITKGLKSQEGVLNVQVSLKDGMGLVEVDSEKIKPEVLLRNKVFTRPSHYKAILSEQ